MSDLLRKAQPPLEFITPAFNPWVLKASQLALPLWLKLSTKITKIETQGIETLVNLYQQFQEKKIRLLIAFRHPSTDDPLCMAYLLWKLMPQASSSLSLPIHAHFIYDRGIPLWAGDGVGWLYSQLGGTPIQRGKMDWVGMRSARQLFLEGDFPLAAAPEGATNGHNEIISPLEPGIAQLCFWCVEDLQKAARQETVLLLPVGIQYYYEQEPWEAIASLLTQLEQDCGLKSPSSPTPNQENLYPRLYNLGEQVLEVMEKFYQQYYHQPLNQDTQSFSERLQQLLDRALKVAEEYFALEPKGNIVDRCRRLEQAGWEYIYREDCKDRQKLAPIEQGLADRLAEEASLTMWHMRLVESFVAVTGYYVREKPSAERFAETSLLLWDLVTRIKGGNPFKRPQLGPQRVKITIADPIVVSERLGQYKSSRRQAVSQLTQDLQSTLESLITTEN